MNISGRSQERGQMTGSQEKRELVKALNSLQTLTGLHMRMAVILWQVNGIACALDFVSQLKASERIETKETR